jgi:cell division protein FtsW
MPRSDPDVAILPRRRADTGRGRRVEADRARVDADRARRGAPAPGPRRPLSPTRPPLTGAHKASEQATAPNKRGNQAFVLLLGLLALLTVVGLVMVLSASSEEAVLQGSSPWLLFEKQVLWVTLGSITLAAVAFIDYRRWRRWAGPLLAGVIGLLVLVCLPHIGIVANGSRRWLGFGQWQFQPSELAKLVVVLFIADLLTRRADRMRDTKFTFRPVAVVIGIIGLLVMKQPDMGTTIVIVAIAAAMLFVAGTPSRTLGLAGVGALGLGGMLGVVAPYRLHRLLSFLHPEKDAGNTGYQAIQARVGMATGGWLGVGIGAGRQKTGYLPNAHTDFIFAVIGEEAGFVGCVLVVLLFVAFALLGVRAALRAPDRFGTLLATGITAWIVVQALVNVGAVVGLLPVTGVPLPFVSFGGSSMVIAMGAVGMLANVARQGR